jgi:hypothetical protein
MNCRYVSTNLRLNHLVLIQFMRSGCTPPISKAHHVTHQGQGDTLNNQFDSKQMTSHAQVQRGSRRRRTPRPAAGSPGCRGRPPRSPPEPPAPQPAHGIHNAITLGAYMSPVDLYDCRIEQDSCVRTAAQTAPHCNAATSRCSCELSLSAVGAG